MKKASDDLVRLVKEMNEADYAMNVMLLQAHESLIDNEITAKQTILLELVHKHGRLTVSELAERMKVSSSAVSQILSKLEKAKYVSREIIRTTAGKSSFAWPSAVRSISPGRRSSSEPLSTATIPSSIMRKL